MPRRLWLLWLSAISLPCGMALVDPPELRDLLGPFGVFSGLILFATWLAARRAHPDHTVLAWRLDRPVRSVCVTLLAFAVAGLLGFAFFEEAVLRRNVPQPLALLAVATAWLVLMRAATIDRRAEDGEPDERRLLILGRTGWRRLALASFSGLVAALLVIGWFTVQLTDAREYVEVYEWDRPYAEDALRREAAREGMPPEHLLEAVWPLIFDLPGQTCVELRSRPGWIGERAPLYCYPEGDVARGREIVWPARSE